MCIVHERRGKFSFSQAVMHVPAQEGREVGRRSFNLVIDRFHQVCECATGPVKDGVLDWMAT